MSERKAYILLTVALLVMWGFVFVSDALQSGQIKYGGSPSGRRVSVPALSTTASPVQFPNGFACDSDHDGVLTTNDSINVYGYLDFQGVWGMTNIRAGQLIFSDGTKPMTASNSFAYTEFDVTDLDGAGNYTWTHSLGTSNPVVTIYRALNGTNEFAWPDGIVATNASTIIVQMASFNPNPWTWLLSAWGPASSTVNP